jgi:hypothetical protein
MGMVRVKNTRTTLDLQREKKEQIILGKDIIN